MKRIILACLCLAIVIPAAAATDIKGQPVPEGSTRVAMCNIGLIFSKYHKTMKFKQELEATLLQPKNEAKRLIDEIQGWSKALQQKNLTPGDKEDYEDRIRAAKQKLDDLDRRIKRMIGKKQEDNLIGIWKDVQTGIRVYALSKQIDIVLGYGDPMQKELLDLFPNINRKMQAMDQGGTVPLFVNPRADISQAIVDWLNKGQDASPRLRSMPLVEVD